MVLEVIDDVEEDPLSVTHFDSGEEEWQWKSGGVGAGGKGHRR